MRKNIAIILISLLLAFTISGCGNAPAAQNGASSGTDAASQSGAASGLTLKVTSGDSDALHSTTVADTAEVISALTALPSRIPGSENNEKAAQWIAGQFELLQLTPLLKEDFFWSYPQFIGGQEALPKNVVGYRRGSDSAKAIIISCHLDAVSGSAGAVDNASGVAAMLRTAANILAADSKLNADIIFCTFNGEEQDYAGSKAFVEEFKEQYKSVCNINFDCVGMIDGGSYMFGAENFEVGYALNQEMRTYLEQYKIPYGSYPVSGVRSDHMSFENAKIPNVNFTQIGIQSAIHSSSDQADKLDTAQIDLLADCVTAYLLECFQSPAE